MLNLPSAFLGLATAFSSALGAPFYDGAIVSEETPGHYDDDGNWVPGEPATERPCKVQIDTVDERMRPEGWTDKDYRFIVLSASITGSIDTDAQVKVTDAKAPEDFQGAWMVSGLQRDPGGIGWVGRGRRA